jgi:ClpX C4-type zinc finger
MLGSRLSCSFCRRRAAEVAKLVAGPRVLLVGPRLYICDGCVALAARYMEDAPADR